MSSTPTPPPCRPGRESRLALFLVTPLLLGVLAPPAAAALVGQWDFDDPADLTRATRGKNLALVGTATAVGGYGTGDGAAAIGIGSHFRCTPDLGPNGGSTTYANEYTLVFDLWLPAASDGQ